MNIGPAVERIASTGDRDEAATFRYLPCHQ